MPLKSKAQTRWGFHKDPEKAREMVEHTSNMKELPERVKEKRKSSRGKRYKRWEL